MPIFTPVADRTGLSEFLDARENGRCTSECDPAELQRMDDKAATNVADVETERHSMNTSILEVEDSKLLRLANQRLFAKAGFGVLLACDGEDALHVARESCPDLILLDVLLPKTSGGHVLRALKANPETAHIPVVVLTGLPQQNESKLLVDGAAAYVRKTDPEVDAQGKSLLQLVQKLLKRSQPPAS